MAAGLRAALVGALLPAGIMASSTASGSDLPLLDIDGTMALRAHDGRGAIASLRADTSVTDTAFHLFKLGLAQYHAGEYPLALRSLRHAAGTDSLLAPVVYEYMARCELGLERVENALASYRATLESDIPQRYQTVLRRTVTELILDQGIDVSELAWTRPWFVPPAVPRDTSVSDVVRGLMETQDWRAVDSVVGLALRADKDRETCEVLKALTLDSIPDTLFATDALFEAAVALNSCGHYVSCVAWLERAENRADFSAKVRRRRWYYLKGMVAYRLKNYKAAIKWLRKYERLAGLSPGVVITLARSYRGLGRTTKAGEWYDRHVAMYPRNSMTQEILWYRAWQREEHGQFSTAISLYRRIRAKHRYGSRASDSFFREGLLLYRKGLLDSAVATWEELNRRYEHSSAATASAYWRAKSLYSLGRVEEAREGMRALVGNSPLDYYGYRARDALAQMGDTTDYLRVNEVVDPEATRTWLRSAAEDNDVEPLSAADSAAYRTGIMLAVAGLDEHAEYYLDPVLLKRTGDLALQYDVASVYAMCGYGTRAYRAGRALAWRIPSELRAAMPLAILSVLYPQAFDSIVQENAALRAVEPTLVTALMRQESMFDPQIKSPVGAVGLMQIMPYTGKEIARDLGEEFVQDSLSSAAVNVRYGTFYVRQLLEQFNGNIVLALASYNGGPHNARKWYDRNKGQDFDLFVENIAFTETRRYVKKVLANYWTYNRLARLDGYFMEHTIGAR